MKITLSAVTAALALVFSGCLSTSTADPQTNIRNAGINAGSSAALSDAVALLTQAGVNSLTAAISKDTQQNANRQNVALLQNAAANLWSVNQPVSFANIITDASAGRAAQTAIEAQKLLAKVDAPAPIVAAAVATVISTATGAPPSTMGAPLAAVSP
jgi:hypothetical protein